MISHFFIDRPNFASVSLPVGLEYKIVYDTTPFILESIHEVYRS